MNHLQLHDTFNLNTLTDVLIKLPKLYFLMIFLLKYHFVVKKMETALILVMFCQDLNFTVGYSHSLITTAATNPLL